ncbi:hypothetical protein ANTPLA_LOCUS1920 [Anthophora plagiata]
MWYFPPDNKSRSILEGIQTEALRLAMSYIEEKDKDRPLVRSINLIEEFTPLLDRFPNLLANTTEYRAQYAQPKIESEFLSNQRNTIHPTEIFQGTIRNKYQRHKIIYTDGSKSDSFLAVGATCIIPDDNYTKKITLPKQASIFTAECIAVEEAFKYIYRYQQRSYIVCTDSLSLNLKEDAQGLEVVIMWIPLHKGILGNQQADREPKEAAQSAENEVHIVPYTDIFPLLKQKTIENTYNELTRQARFKGGLYFIWINRVRSNHYNLKASLKRVNIVQDTSCQCGFPMQDVDHVLWDCTCTQTHRQEMVQRLGAKELTPPYTIEKFLKEPNIAALKIEDFVIKNNIKM